VGSSRQFKRGTCRSLASRLGYRWHITPLECGSPAEAESTESAGSRRRLHGFCDGASGSVAPAAWADLDWHVVHLDVQGVVASGWYCVDTCVRPVIAVDPLARDGRR
jgi:hypothetical protein